MKIILSFKLVCSSSVSYITLKIKLSNSPFFNITFIEPKGYIVPKNHMSFGKYYVPINVARIIKGFRKVAKNIYLNDGLMEMMRQRIVTAFRYV